MIKLFKRLIEWLLYFGEDTDPSNTMARFNRRWRYWPDVSWWRGRLCVGYNIELLQMNGEVYDEPCPVAGRYIEFIFDPRQWSIGYDHSYYDGPHHRTNAGPFAYYTDYAWNCKGCCGER